ncbi:outer membrane protein TolC [Paraburkholderia sp. RAU2J]|uniref:TolC family protein n=1 Tax=Paraburkholderia sp. RAU2J TaxID=1938810 RepID=UPI000EACD1AA|nr:TolC family protein [Paraburkholderia sp. RAU2J]RKT20493.1 outer membrane protein TolC [Paraburkholderia sp. RAU2J]
MPVFNAAAPANRVANLAVRPWLRCLAPVCALLLGGCAWYHREPLAPHDTSTSARSLERIQIDASRMPLPELAAHRFDPSDGLDIDEVAMLAVANNPELKLARDDLGIARAQAYSAGLLPDPQLSVSSDYPGAVGTTRAFNYGLSIDVMAIVLRSANKQSADATVAKTDLGLLWQEWQIVAQARQLFIKTRFQQDTLPLLEQQRELARTRYERMAEARRDGNLTDDTLTAALTAYSDARKQSAEAERAAEQTHHDLNALLGLSPEVRLQLAGGEDIAPLSGTTLDAALASLAQRRPDLIALQAGYEAQEQKYRAAILSQFPSLSVGFVRARDTSNIYTSGFQINLSLPIFNRNQGNVAIEKATRQRLRDEYQTRLNQAYADVAHLRADKVILTRQLQQTEAALPDADLAAQHAAAAFAGHDLTLGAYTDAQSASLTKRIDVATLRESLAEQRVGLQALLGSAIPDAFSSSAQTFTETHDAK